MIAAIYDPYLDTIGGGERYTLTVAKVIQEAGFEIDLFWDDASILETLEARFEINLKKINVLPNIFSNRNFLGTGSYLRSYDIVFIVSDGSIPFMTGKNNLLHFQVPFKNVNGKRLINRLKMRSINHFVCNSNFTKKQIDMEYGISSVVIYPPIAVDRITKTKKQNLILSIGRFSELLQNKRQDVLIDSFKELFDQGVKDWKLVLAGGTDVGGKMLAETYKRETKGYPIEVIENPTFSELLNLYGKASIFWYAAGYQVDEKEFPQKVEHFGITSVEAMSAGCVPIVHPKGGVLEIVTNKKDGFYWNTPTELLKLTRFLIFNPKTRDLIGSNAQARSRSFSEAVFSREFKKII